MVDDTPERSSPWSPVLLGFLLLLFAWPALVLLAGLYAHDGAYSHGFIVPVVAAALARLAWQRRGGAPLQPAWSGVLPVLVGAGMLALGIWYDAALGSRRGTAWMCSTGLVVTIAGLVAGTAGWRGVRVLAFPLCYLSFAIVWPGAVVESVSLPLRRLAAAIAAVAVGATGIPVLREGNVLHLAGTTLGVDDACSGLHSLGILLATACGVAYWQQLGWVRGGVLTLAAPAVAVLANVLRVGLTAILVHHFGMVYASGARHEALGYLTFALGLGAVLGLGRALRPRVAAPTEPVPGASPPGAASGEPGSGPQSPVAAPRRRTWAPAVGAAVVLLAGAAFLFAVRTRYAHAPVRGEVLARESLEGFPVTVGEFAGVGADPLGEEVLRMLKPSDVLHRSYRAGEERTVDCTLLYWDPMIARSLAATAAPHNPDVCFGALGGQRLDVHDAVVDLGVVNATLRVFDEGDDTRVVLSWQRFNWNVVPRGFLQRLRFLASTWHEPIRLGARYSVIVSTYAGAGVTGGSPLDEAKRRCVRFAEAIVPLLPAYGIAAEE